MKMEHYKMKNYSIVSTWANQIIRVHQSQTSFWHLSTKFCGHSSRSNLNPLHNKGCVTLWPLPFTLKCILMPKKNYMKTQIFHHAKIYLIFNKKKKKPLKETKILQTYYYNSRPNLKFQQQAKISSFKNPFKLLYSIMNLNTISRQWSRQSKWFTQIGFA